MRIACPSCGQHYEIDVAPRGQQVRCRICGHIFVLAADSAPPVAQVLPPKEPPPAQPEEPKREPKKDSSGCGCGFVSLLVLLAILFLILRGKGYLGSDIFGVTVPRQKRTVVRTVPRSRNVPRPPPGPRTQPPDKRDDAEPENAPGPGPDVEARRRLDELKRQLADLESGGAADDAGIAALTGELEQVDRKLNDPRYRCFDFCVLFQKIQFKRIMRDYKLRPSPRGYYYAKYGLSPYKQVRRHKQYEKVEVAYHCDLHHQDWTRQEAERYLASGYVPLRELEGRKSELERRLKALKNQCEQERQRRISKLKTEISDAERAIGRRTGDVPD